jgi:hypothetical protein
MIIAVLFLITVLCFCVGYFSAKKYSELYANNQKQTEKIWEFFRNTAVQIGAMLFALTTALTIYSLQMSNNERMQDEAQKRELQFMIFTRTTKMLEALNDFRDLRTTDFIPYCFTSQTVIYNNECNVSSKEVLNNITNERDHILSFSGRLADEFKFTDDFRSSPLMREQVSLKSLVLGEPFGNLLELNPLSVYADVDQPYQDLLIREHALATIVKALRTVVLFDDNSDAHSDNPDGRKYVNMIMDFDRVWSTFRAALIDYLERYCVIAGAAQSEPSKMKVIFSRFNSMVEEYIRNNNNINTKNNISPLDWRYAYVLKMYETIGPSFGFLDSNCGEFISKSGGK